MRLSLKHILNYPTDPVHDALRRQSPAVHYKNVDPPSPPVHAASQQRVRVVLPPACTRTLAHQLSSAPLTKPRSCRRNIARYVDERVSMKQSVDKASQRWNKLSGKCHLMKWVAAKKKPVPEPRYLNTIAGIIFRYSLPEQMHSKQRRKWISRPSAVKVHDPELDKGP